MSQHWRMELNRYCQEHHILIQWTESRAGPAAALTWTASAWVNGIEYGRGSALNVGAAREIAAEQAIRTLWSVQRA